MLFTSLEYLLFLPATLVLYWTLPHAFRVPLLLIASYLFYMSWNTTLVLLIFAMTVFNFFLGDVLSKASVNRKLIFGIGIVANLACLSYFKYSNFFVNSANGLFHLAGLPTQFDTLNIILPLGISFFVFEFIHYLFDIYRGSQPLKSFALFGLFAAFFPTQIAGPIKRYDDFSAQMVEEKKLKLEYFDEGVPLIIIGLAKKVLIANNLAILVDMMVNSINSYGALELWIFSFAFTFQVYFDFSGYTDIARGSSILFGYRIPINFNLPFIAANASELWNRWHISLSNWLRDYLFRPLGGTKRNRLTVDRALILTMTLGGLWHGASWNFVIWGAYFGLCLAIHRNFKRLKPKMPALSGFFQSKYFNALSIALTFSSFAFSASFFRIADLKTDFSIIKKMITFSPLLSPNSDQFVLLSPALPVIVPCVLVMLMLLLLLNVPLSYIQEKGYIKRFPAPLKAAYLAFVVAAILIYLPSTSTPFIYFQF